LSLFLALAEGLLTFVLTSRQAQFAQRIADLPMLQGFLKGLLGVEMAESIGPGMLAAVAWVHPVILAITWAHAIIIATRVPAGEIERGTIDVLLGLPISRRELFITETFACMSAGLVLMLAAAAGHAIGGRFLDPSLRLEPARVAIIVVNLYAVYLTVGAMAMLLSALSDRRGRAMSIAFGLVVGSFLINALAQAWKPAEHLSFLSLLSYHRPLRVMRTGDWPVGDLLRLGGAAVLMWLGAGVVLARRDITTT
jgi:ABC-type Na+ efflux pump permease subunit